MLGIAVTEALQVAFGAIDGLGALSVVRVLGAEALDAVGLGAVGRIDGAAALLVAGLFAVGRTLGDAAQAALAVKLAASAVLGVHTLFDAAVVGTDPIVLDAITVGVVVLAEVRHSVRGDALDAIRCVVARDE